MLTRLGLGCAFALFVLVRPTAAPVTKELVYFASGDVLAVTGHRIDGDTIVIELAGGGEIVCDAALIDRIELDRRRPPVAVVPEPEAEGAPRLPAKPYADLVQTASERHGIDPVLLHAMIEVESGYRADATSPRGAMGLMQLMPETAARYDVEDPFDPVANIDAGAEYLRFLLDRFGMTGGLAAYNAGEGSVRRFHGIPPFPETRQYVSKVLDLVDAAQDD